MQQVFPSLFDASLPLTRQDVEGGGEGRLPISKRGSAIVRRRRATEFRLDPRSLLIIFLALSTLGMLFIMSQRIPSHV